MSVEFHSQYVWLSRIFVDSFTERIRSIFYSLTCIFKTNEEEISNLVHTLLLSCLAGAVAMAVTEWNENEVVFQSTFIAW